MDRLLVMNSPLWRPPVSGGSQTTQTVALTGGTLVQGTLVGSTLVAAMGDASDATYLQCSASSTGSGEYVGQVTGGMFAAPSLLPHVTSFVVNFRSSATPLGTGNGPHVYAQPGAATNEFAAFTTIASSTPVALQVGPFTKAGGGTWTPAQVAALSFELDSEQANPPGILRTYELSLTATA